MERRRSIALLSVLFFGIALLYVPILVLIAYSFNASPLVNVWGGFSTAWYGQLLHNRQLLEAALLSPRRAYALWAAATHYLGALRTALADPRAGRTFAEGGMDPYPANEQSPEAASALLKHEIKRWGDVIRANNISGQ